MKKSLGNLCILGGLYFTISFLLSLLGDLLSVILGSQMMTKLCTSSGLSLDFVSKLVSMFYGLLDLSLTAAFVVLFVVCLFRPEKLKFLQYIADHFAKTTIYLSYIGFAGYILYIVSIFLFVPLRFMALSQTVAAVLAWSLLISNFGGFVIALALATYTAFFKRKN